MTSVLLTSKHKITLSVLSLILMTLISCGEQRFFVKHNNGKLIDKRLVGIWKGSESNQLVEGMSSEWEMTRRLDGSFTLEAKVTIDGELQEFTELGSWWISDGLFYELHNDSGKTDIYYYDVISKRQVKFKVKKMAFDIFKDDYEFIDTKISD